LTNATVKMTKANPETVAETTNRGPSSALCQPGLALSSPRIQAVTECSATAKGRATTANTFKILRSLATA